jgi:anti-sigma B factor antagonist
MALQIETRHVGKVTVVKCSGRIVGGEESESLREHVSRRMPAERLFLLDLAEVTFIDSTGLGMLVRLLAAARSARGDLKLCHASKQVADTLYITNLNRMLETHASDAEAVSAFYQHSISIESARRCGKTVVCVEQSADVLAYVREVLRQAGYDPLTTASVSDARILIKAVRPDLVILGPSVLTTPGGKHESLRHVLHGIPVIELGSKFSTIDAGEAAQLVLEQVKAKIAGAGN